MEIIENNVTIESEPDVYRMKVRFLFKENAVENDEFETHVQEKTLIRSHKKQE